METIIMTDTIDTQTVVTVAATPNAASKSAVVQKLLNRTKGASIAEIVSATSWQPHSARAFLTGLRKKGAVIIRESRKDGETSYRITN